VPKIDHIVSRSFSQLPSLRNGHWTVWMNDTNNKQHDPRRHPSRQLFPPRPLDLLRVRERESMQTSQLRVGEEVADELPKSSVRCLLGRLGGECAAVVLVLICLFHQGFQVKREFFGHGGCWCGHLTVCTQRRGVVKVDRSVRPADANREVR
jgi:hypothetical protein